MTLYRKTIVAFALSLAVTLLLAFAAYSNSRQIESTNTRLSLSVWKLHELEALKHAINAHRVEVTEYLLTADESHLSAASTAIARATETVERLIDESKGESTAPHPFSQGQPGSGHDELSRLIELGARLLEADQVIAPIVAIEQRGDEERAEARLQTDYQRHYLGGINSLLSSLYSEESAQFAARTSRHSQAVGKLRSNAVIFCLIASGVTLLAVLFLKRSLDAIDELNRRETAANIAKSTFLANMSHEIRTPLNAILGFARLLTKDPVVSKSFNAMQHVTTILSSGRHLLSVINDILDLSKVEAGQFKCNRTSCEVVSLMEEVVSLVRVRANAKAIPLDFTWTGPVPRSIHTDPVRFKQIVVNLVGNAIKFTDRGRVSVEGWLEQSENGSQVVVEVTDTGIGIRQEDQEAIFTPFFQADGSLTREFEGTGLGLAICKRMAELLGGEILVRSQVGVGSTFTVRIDAGSMAGVEMMSSLSKGAPQSRAATASPTPPNGLRGQVILVVDDGKTNRELVRAVTEQAGARVVEAGNGLLGVEAALAQSVDAVLMDVQMPVMDGLTAAAVLRSRGFEKPIIALTAHAMSGDKERCLEAGCSGYLTKPLDPDELVNELIKQIGVTDTTTPECAAVDPHHSLAEGQPIVCSLPIENEVFLGIAQRFVGDLVERLDVILDEFENSDWEALGNSAHWLKGAGGTAGFHCFTEPASSLSLAADAQDTAGTVAALNELRSLIARMPEEYRTPTETVVR